MTDLNVTALFPTFIFAKDYPDSSNLNPRLARASFQLRRQDPDGVRISNRIGWQSQDDLNTHADFAPFVDFVEQTLREIKEFLLVDDDLTLRVSTCWVNINGEGGFNTRHIHGNAYFSGVYYVKVPTDSGVIRFFDPNPVRECFHLPYKEIDAKNCFHHSVKPVEGRILIFPGYVAHDVSINRSIDERISISFNVGAR
ncbi:MAG TPA: TIGR02466 family protein [Gammaproteobacteria bacterium]|jgi:uncharacterized protein (TIGR02466 family)